MKMATLKAIGQSTMFLRIASLIAGTTLWFYVLNSEPVRVEREFPLNLSLPQGLVLANNYPSAIKVELKGARVFLGNVQPHGLEMLAEVTSTTKKQTLRLTPSMLPIPFGVEVVSIIPDTINIQLVKESSKTFKVRPVVLGDAGPDVAFDIDKMVPGQIKLSGPWNVLKDIKDVPTVAVNWQDLDATKTVAKVAIRELDPRLKIDGPSEVELHYKVRPKKANLTLKNIPIRFVSTSLKVASRVKAVSVDVLAPENTQVPLTGENVQILADVPHGKKGSFTIDLRAVLPEGVHLLQIHPSSINITVK
ncbi:MAG: hypothetical protein CME71_12475 [Halobacteriovorax sp.]|mgnify:FL=1|nr:hypothetical protein [Halobacteriovorax sp.]